MHGFRREGKIHRGGEHATDFKQSIEKAERKYKQTHTHMQRTKQSTV